ncbi:MAG: hypothetical protein R2941_25870 [Desulfobacterales bacterium]
MKYCQGNPGSAEAVFGWSRSAVETGLTGIICIGAQAAKSGGIVWEKRESEAAGTLRQTAEDHSQQDPTFRSTVAAN